MEFKNYDFKLKKEFDEYLQFYTNRNFTKETQCERILLRQPLISFQNFSFSISKQVIAPVDYPFCYYIRYILILKKNDKIIRQVLIFDEYQQQQYFYEYFHAYLLTFLQFIKTTSKDLLEEAKKLEEEEEKFNKLNKKFHSKYGSKLRKEIIDSIINFYVLRSKSYTYPDRIISQIEKELNSLVPSISLSEENIGIEIIKNNAGMFVLGTL